MTSEAAGASRRVPAKMSFDLEERARLRAKLLRYMQEHGIGTPTLLNRIAEKSGRSPDLIPLKTLQRFMEAHGRTNDAFLIPCQMFAEALPETDPASDLGDELGRFFELVPGRKEDSEGISRIAPDRLAGLYSVYAPAREGGFRVMKTTEELERDNYTTLYSRCSVERHGRDGPLLISEQVFDPDNLKSPPGSASLQRTFEGVVLFFNPLVFIVAKDMATRLPRVYWLHEVAEGFFGQAMEDTLMSGPAPSATAPVTRLRFRRERTEEKTDG